MNAYWQSERVCVRVFGHTSPANDDPNFLSGPTTITAAAAAATILATNKSLWP